MPAVTDLETLEYKLTKRGFRRDDVFLHECPDCQEKAVLTYVLSKGGKLGGRSINLCMACGASKSWRAGAGMADRTEDPDWDLRAFLG